MKSIAVFCGSSAGVSEAYLNIGCQLGKALAGMGVTIVYGGSKTGVMGAVADGALSAGGRVTGVIPGFLKTKEVAHDGATEMITVSTMHERKLKMFELSDAFIALPGGWGTMEELFEILSWAQLGMHEKPIGLLNTNGYYEPLKELCAKMVREGFLSENVSAILLLCDTIEGLLLQMRQYKPPHVKKWVSEQTT